MPSSDQASTPDQPGAPTGSPPAIPGHELLRRIANGSYGEIWLARTELGAFRAVKIIRRANFSNAKPFDREFAGIQRYEPISREHEGLVDVLQVGRDEPAGFFYYVMELADRAVPESEKVSRCESENLPPAHSPTFSPAAYSPLTLAHAIRVRNQLPVTEVVELGISLARALEFLHSRRLVHRDIKPSNIIFVGGQPKLADVGLVADLDGPQTLVGTEGYIPPEGPGSAQADIYSLGKVLYEAATGNDRQEFPDLALQLGETTDKALLELNEVLLKACESNPRARYATAAAMAADLERLEAGQSLRLRRARQKRFRATATAAGLFAGLMIVGAGLTAFVQHERSKPRLLFRDDFDEAQPDTNSWTLAHRSWFGENGRGTPTAHFGQVGGELNLHTQVDHEKDSVFEGVWADLNYDFRRLSSCSLEIAFSGSTLGGLLAVSLTSGNAPTNFSDFAGEKLVYSLADLNQTNVWQARTMRVDILPASQTAIVYPEANHTNEFDVVDLQTLAAWHLRFYCSARASKDFRSGESDLRIESIVVWSQPDDGRIVGRVDDQISGSPIADAVIKDASGKLITRSAATGAFVIPGSPSGPLTVEKTGYTNANGQALSLGDQSAIARIMLCKSNFSRGDIVAVFPYGNLDVKDITVSDNQLAMLVQDSNSNFSLRFADLDSWGGTVTNSVVRRFEFEPDHGVNSLAECGTRWIGVGHWPGEIYDLHSRSPQRLLTLTNEDTSPPINWPAGCTFDGELLWFLESDLSRKNHQLHALNLTTLRLMDPLSSADERMQGLAWDGKQFWISSGEGRVYAVNRDDAVRGRTVEAGLRVEFSGSYDRLAYGREYLWGLQFDKRRVCKIKVKD